MKKLRSIQSNDDDTLDDGAWNWMVQKEDLKPKMVKAGRDRRQPTCKTEPPVNITPNLAGLRTDLQYEEFMMRNRLETAVVNFSSSWCNHCHKMFPAFISFSSKFPIFKYAVAQVDYMTTSPSGIEYTPTFAVFKKGRKVDQFFGVNPQQLRDHLWLHSD